jgi:hypothetical protein
MRELPDLWKGQDEYALNLATRLWAWVRAGVPLCMSFAEKRKYRAEYEAAEKELLEHVDFYRKESTRRVTEPPPVPFCSDDPWLQPDCHQPPSRRAEVEVKGEQYCRGEDLSALANAFGYQGVFGFEQEVTHDDTRTRTSRKTRLRAAVEAAREALMATYEREPTAREVVAYLERGDPTECVVDFKEGILVWVDYREKCHDTTHKAIANMLTGIRKAKT